MATTNPIDGGQPAGALIGGWTETAEALPGYTRTKAVAVRLD